MIPSMNFAVKVAFVVAGGAVLGHVLGLGDNVLNLPGQLITRQLRG